MPSAPCQEKDQVICFCSGTKRGQIEALFLQGESLEAISQRTGALSGCGGCEWDITGMLLELAAEQNLQK